MVDRINLILKAKNITARQFAEEIGIQPSGMSHILSGRNNPSLDFVMKVIRRYPEIDIQWLMFGKGEMYESASRRNMYQQQPLQTSPVSQPQSTVSKDVKPSAIQTTDKVGFHAGATPAASQQTDLFASSVDMQDDNVLDSDDNTVSNDDVPNKETANNPSQPSAASKATAVDSAASQVDENRKNDAARDDGQKKSALETKKIVKVVILYNDHSFSEYTPE